MFMSILLRIYCSLQFMKIKGKVGSNFKKERSSNSNKNLSVTVGQRHQNAETEVASINRIQPSLTGLINVSS